MVVSNKSDFTAVDSASVSLRSPLNIILIALTLMISIACLVLLLRPDLGVALDAALYLHGAERLLAGGQLYIDFVDINPPLAVWLHVPPVLLAQVTGLSVISAFLALLIAATVLSGWVTYRVLTRTGEASLSRISALCLCFVLPAVMVILDTEWQLGQRSFLLVVALLPYLAVRLRRSVDGEVAAALAFAVGIFTGVVLSLKPPHYVSILLPAEIYLLYRAGHIRFWFTPETYGVVAAVAMYAAYLVFFLPEPSAIRFFDELLPLIVQAYQDLYGNSAEWLKLKSFQYLFLPLVTVTAVWGLLRDSENRAEEGLCTLACLIGWAGAVVFVIQAKGWAYHAIPTWFAASLALFLVLGRMLPEFFVWVKNNPVASGLGMVATVAGLLLITLIGAAKLGEDARESELGELVLEHTDTDASIYVLSTGVDPTFPLVQQLERRMATRFPFAFLVPMSYYDAIPDDSALHGYRPNKDFMHHEAQFLADLNADLLAEQPQLIAVRRSCYGCPYGMELHDYVIHHSDTLTAFAPYRRLERDRTDKFDVWILSGGRR